MTVPTLYFDYAATTPVDPSVAAAMQECLTNLGVFGNPASKHVYGRAARERVELARAQVAGLIGAAADEIVWTSGATESNNLALLGTGRAALLRVAGARSGGARPHVITQRTEHASVLDACHQLEREGVAVTYLECDREGIVEPEAVRAALQAGTVLVSIMHVNNETGVVQDIAAIGAICRERGVALHVDAAQSAGRLSLDLTQLPVDLLSLTAHKLYGPKGAGALFVRRERRMHIQPLLFGGGHERGLRSGTLPVHQIVGLGAACEITRTERDDESARISALRDRLWSGLRRIDAVLLNGHATRRVGGILNVSFVGVEGESLLYGLPELALSTGSACHSDSDEPSYVLRALGRGTELAQSALRFSLGRYTSAEDVERAIAAVTREVTRLRAIAGTDAGSGPPSAAPAGAAHAGTLARVGAAAGAGTQAGAGAAGGVVAGAGAPDSGEVLIGEAGRRELGVQVRFELLLHMGRLALVRYRAYGCPDTLAACEWVACRLEGEAITEGENIGNPRDWATNLDIPVKKLGRLLVVEDALRIALRQGIGIEVK
jgi:cysteine desulfurase